MRNYRQVSKNSSFVNALSIGNASGGFIPTISIAAHNSSIFSKDAAHYICTGTDDHLTFNKALMDLPSEGGRIVFMEGDFNFSDYGGTTNNKDNISIEGFGMSTIINGPGIQFVKSTGIESLEIKNIQFTGDKVGLNTYNPISTGNLDQTKLIVQNVKLMRMFIGGNVLIKDSIIMDSISNYVSPNFRTSISIFNSRIDKTISLNNSSFVKLESCNMTCSSFINLYNGGLLSIENCDHKDENGGINVSNTYGGGIKFCSIINNRMIGSSRLGIYALQINGSSDKILIANNLIDNFAVAISLNNSSTNVWVNNNDLRNNTLAIENLGTGNTIGTNLT